MELKLDEQYSQESKGELISQKQGIFQKWSMSSGESQSQTHLFPGQLLLLLNPSWVSRHLQRLHVVNKSGLMSSFPFLSIACLFNPFTRKTKQNKTESQVKVDPILYHQVKVIKLPHTITRRHMSLILFKYASQ